MTTTVQASNLVTIPSGLARECNIRAGTRLEWSRAGAGKILVKPLVDRGELARQLLGAGRPWVRAGSDPIRDSIRERKREDKLSRPGEQ